ncbi:DUF3124 domain-containing protein [Marinigracilibium pacificum]|uniref:DUF3124 domain-containing protein n=1 Tax=Marinigracilibium pacificum TaxID=2729599 RepID=A0A848IZT1_9BACT|nr:DUF3124 domain-containing protein [Marinigracilibium pacificum]NMM48891.1 DUF3124 domain-containing protein [Marinigracilibium pacificum]
MKNLSLIFLLMLTTLSCQEEKSTYATVNPVNWDLRTTDLSPQDSLINGQSYLSVYSQIYSQTEHRTHDLTATISLRNMNASDTLYITKAEYFDTHGKSIRTYFKKTIYIAPMETVEIIIKEEDREGGTGGNFIFDWSIKPNTYEPLFEAVMISTYGQQGLSFTTQGKRLK